MNNSSTSPAHAAIGLLCFFVILFHGMAAPAQGSWFFEIGGVYRDNMRISVDGGSRAAESGPGTAWTWMGTDGQLPTAQASLLRDDGSQTQLRTFDDGFVGLSGWQWAQDAGLTQFWGYERQDQYEASSDTLVFNHTLTRVEHASRRLTHAREEWSGWSDSEHVNGFGIMATIGFRLPQDFPCTVDLLFQIGWIDDIQGRFRNKPSASFTHRESQYMATLTQQETYAYLYDTLGNPAFPDAPYTMSTPSGVGPMIPDRPQSIEQTGEQSMLSDSLTHRSTGTWNSHTDLDVDAQALLLQAGPRLVVHAGQSLAVTVQPLLSLNRIDVDAKRVETLRDASGFARNGWVDTGRDHAWRGGAGIHLGTVLRVTDSWYLRASVGYEWVDEMRVNVGPDRVKLDLSGGQGELALGFAF